MAAPTGLDRKIGGLEEMAVAMEAAGEQGIRRWTQRGRRVSRLYTLFVVDHILTDLFIYLFWLETRRIR